MAVHTPQDHSRAAFFQSRQVVQTPSNGSLRNGYLSEPDYINPRSPSIVDTLCALSLSLSLSLSVLSLSLTFSVLSLSLSSHQFRPPLILDELNKHQFQVFRPPLIMEEGRGTISSQESNPSPTMLPPRVPVPADFSGEGLF